MRYNAGSEVYSQTLCQGLADRHEVHVFTREEDSFAPDYRLRTETDSGDDRITLHLVNNPRNKDRYRVAAIDERFAATLDRVQPDVVHVGYGNSDSSIGRGRCGCRPTRGRCSIANRPQAWRTRRSTGAPSTTRPGQS